MPVPPNQNLPSRRAVTVVAATATASVLLTSGAAAQTAEHLFLFQYSPGPAWRAGVPMRGQALAPHGAYMQTLQAQGRLFAAGGYENAEGGMAIISAADFEEASALLAADPAIVSGIFVAELRQWRPRFRTDQALPATP